mgnify:CR=1 FL=1
MKLIIVYVVISEDLYFIKVSKDLNESLYNLFLADNNEEILDLARQNETDLSVIRSHIKNGSKIIESKLYV